MTEVLAVREVDPPPSPPSRYDRVPWWVRIAVVFAASRVVTTVILLIFAAHQPRNAWTGASPDYFAFAGIWDGTWYHIVAVNGYPAQLPYLADGHVGENAWAFLPAYPMLLRALGFLTGAPFEVLGVLVSLGFAFGTALVFYRLLLLVVPGSTALFSVVLLCVAPLSPILQVTYAEPMAMFFLACSLYFLLRRRYWMILPFVTVLAFTRPSALAFALTLGLHLVYRWRTRRRDPFPRRELLAAGSVTVLTVLLGLAWPAIAWAVTRIPTAYTDTELVWRAPYIGWARLVPFSPWLEGANWWLRPYPLGGILLVVTVALFGASLFLPAVRRLGVDLRLWSASWALYLLAVFFPQSSTFRLLMPLFPLLGAAAAPRSRTYRVVLVALCIAAQVGWVYIAWWVDGIDWTPP